MNINSKDALDVILQYSLKKEYLDISIIKKNLFNDLNDDEITYLLTNILNYEDEIAEVQISEYNSIIKANGMTQNFLNQGGFSKIYKKREQELDREKELKDLEFEKSKIDLELAKKMLKDFPRTKVISYISIFIGICLALLEIAKATGLIN